jgi:hypothetical protein
MLFSLVSKMRGRNRPDADFTLVGNGNGRVSGLTFNHMGKKSNFNFLPFFSVQIRVSSSPF